MTVLQPPPAPAAAGGVLRRADGVAILGQQQGSGYKVPPALVRRADGQVLQLTPLIFATLQAVDGRRGLAEVAAEASRIAGRTLAPDDVDVLVNQRLRPLGLLALADGSQPQTRKANPLLRLRPRIVVSGAEATARVTAPFARLFNPVLVVAATLAFVAVTYWVLVVKGLASAAYQAFANPGLLLAVFAMTVVSAGFHEFGHAAALRRGGGTPEAMGAGLYIIWPAFYTDVTDAYRLDRRARVRTDLGGLYFNALAALVIFGLWWVSGWDGFLLAIAAQLLQMLRQLPPLIRFDGYHLLADATGVPDLFHRIGPTLRSLVPGRRQPEAQALKPWVRGVVTLWVVVVVPLLLFSAFLTVVALPHTVATAARSLQRLGGQVSSEVAHDHPLVAAVKVLSILAVAVPIVGVVLILARTVRRLAVRVIRATAGKPGKRALAALTAAALVGALTYAWWPRGDYTPIRPYQRGTVEDALPASLVSPGHGLVAGRQVSGVTLLPGTGSPAGDRSLPTAAHPELAVVFSPRSGAGPSWVFPFNRPPGPGAGDNQALAIVTRNGGTVYDVAFALVWATSNSVRNVNSAYAFASCRGCKAVAVAFQVVLVVGDAHVVAPENLAAAASYDCVSCVTEALATQLVLSLPGPLDPAQTSRLDALWAQVAAFAQRSGSLSFAAMQARLSSYERQIVGIVEPAAATSPGSGSVSPAPGPAGGGSTGVTSGPSGTSTTAPSGTSGQTTPPVTSGAVSSTTVTTTGGAGSSGSTGTSQSTTTTSTTAPGQQAPTTAGQ